MFALNVVPNSTIFIVNCFAHVTTVKSLPGQKFYHSIGDAVFALFFPFSGIHRALEAFACGSSPKNSTLQKAVRARAVCIVIRSYDWDPARCRLLENIQAFGTVVPLKRLDEELARDTIAENVENATAEVIEMVSFNEQHPRDGVAENMTDATAEFAESSSPRQGTYLPVATRIVIRHHEQLFDRLTLMNGFTGNTEVCHRNVHGSFQLPKSYMLAYLPSNAKVNPDAAGSTKDTKLSYSYNVPKIIIAVIQAVYASVTLYRARGDELERYGYAAAALTVIPYLLMPILNLCSNILLTDYPCVFPTRSYELDEAISAGAKVDGLVGRLEQSASEEDQHSEKPISFSADETGRIFARIGDGEYTVQASSAADGIRLSIDSTPQHSISEEDGHSTGSMDEQRLLVVPSCRFFETIQSQKPFLSWMSIYILGPLPYAIIAGLTRFHKGQSTLAQRTWTMTWLSLGVLLGPTIQTTHSLSNGPMPSRLSTEPSPTYWTMDRKRSQLRLCSSILCYTMCTVPIIGGFVVVGQMLKNYGYCTLF